MISVGRGPFPATARNSRGRVGGIYCETCKCDSASGWLEKVWRLSRVRPDRMAKHLVLVFVLLGCGRSIAQPSNDNFADAIELTGARTETSVDSTGATSEEFEPDHAGNVATASVWWRWVAPADGGLTIHTGQS